MTAQIADLFPTDGKTFYGRRVWTLGEDGDLGLMVEGHGRRALAAMVAHERDLHGASLWIGDVADADRAEKWVRFIHTCGCTEDEHAAHPRDMYSNGWCDHDCKHDGLPPCRPDQYGWAWDYVQEGEEGALPVLEVWW